METPFKKDGTLKQKYKDMPRFNTILEYEDLFKKEFDKSLITTGKMLIDKFNSILKR